MPMLQNQSLLLSALSPFAGSRAYTSRLPKSGRSFDEEETDDFDVVRGSFDYSDHEQQQVVTSTSSTSGVTSDVVASGRDYTVRGRASSNLGRGGRTRSVEGGKGKNNLISAELITTVTDGMRSALNSVWFLFLW